MHGNLFFIVPIVFAALVVCTVSTSHAPLRSVGSVTVPALDEIISGVPLHTEGDVSALDDLAVVGVLGCFPAIERAFPSLVPKRPTHLEIHAVQYNKDVALLVVLGACRPRRGGNGNGLVDGESDGADAMVEIALAELSDAVMVVVDESVTDAMRAEALALRVSQLPGAPTPLAGHVLRGDVDTSLQLYRSTMSATASVANLRGTTEIFEAPWMVHCVTSDQVGPCVDEAVARLRGSRGRREAPLSLQAIVASVTSHAHRLGTVALPRGEALCLWVNAPYVVRGAATIAAARQRVSDDGTEVLTLRIELLTQARLARLECDVVHCAKDTVVIAVGYDNTDEGEQHAAGAAGVGPHVAAYRVPFSVSNESAATFRSLCAKAVRAQPISTLEVEFTPPLPPEYATWIMSAVAMICLCYALHVIAKMLMPLPLRESQR